MQGLLQLPPIIIVTIALLIPTVRVLRRMGKSRWWALFALVPIFGIIVLMWILAYSRWPAQRNVADVFA
ncbi:MAG TPA: hypothetical protein VLV76_06445 [Candidatus Acidoferrum sp.]|nr:hypothetical protein [Candidatus Acidoferrum sp.]